MRWPRLIHMNHNGLLEQHYIRRRRRRRRDLSILRFDGGDGGEIYLSFDLAATTAARPIYSSIRRDSGDVRLDRRARFYTW